MKTAIRYLTIFLTFIMCIQQTGVIGLADEIIKDTAYYNDLSEAEILALMGEDAGAPKDVYVSSGAVDVENTSISESTTETESSTETTTEEFIEKEIADTEIDNDVELYQADISLYSEDVKKLLGKYNNFNMLDKDEQILFRNSAELRPELMSICADNGYNILESIPKAAIMQKLEISLNECVFMINSFGSEVTAKEEADYFWARTFNIGFLNDDVVKEEVINLLVKGHTLDAILNSYAAAQILNLPISELIWEEENQEISKDFGFTQENIAELNNIAEEYHIKIDKLAEYVSLNCTEISELEIQIYAKAVELGVIENEIMLLADSSDEESDHLIGPFSLKNNFKDSVALNSGSLIYEENILNIPGANGLDLDLTLFYESDNYTVSDNYHELALGWRFGFSQIYNKYREPLIPNGHSYDCLPHYIKFSDGVEYNINSYYVTGSNKGKVELKIEDYPFEDIKMGDSANIIPSTKYFVEYKDGKKEYFDNEGRIKVIEDRFNNKIEFTYTSSGYAYTNMDIKDVRGGITNVNISIDASGNKSMTITQPDGKNITYNFTKTANNKNFYYLSSKVDQLGRTTSFEYDYAKYKSLSNDRGYIGANLTKIIFPTGLNAVYDYESTNDSALNSKYYRLEQKYYEMNNKKYNKEVYSYSTKSNYTGYVPPRTVIKDFEDYTYYTNVEYSNGINKRYTFDVYNHKISEETKYKQSNGSNAVFSTIKYEYEDYEDSYKNGQADLNYRNPYPTTITTEYSSSCWYDEKYTYDRDGNITEYSRNKGAGSTNDNYKITYTYDNCFSSNINPHGYSLLKSEEYKKDSNTTIKTVYNLKPDRKSVDSTEVFTNGALSAKAEYLYYEHGGIKQKKDYVEKIKNTDEYEKIVTDYEYEANGSDLIKTTIDGISKELGYDSLGRIVWEKDGKGQETEYVIDAFGNITQIKYPDGSVKKNQYNYYDNYVIMENEIGTKIKYDYDPAGNLETISDLSNWKSYDIEKYEYDSMMRLDNKTVLNTDSSCNTKYGYDELSRLKNEKTIENGSKVLYDKEYIYNYANYNYSETVLIKGDENSEKIKSSNVYDLAGKVVDEIVYGSNERNQEVVKQKISYTYDYADNVEQSTKYISNNTPMILKYKYDYAGRLTEAKYSNSNIIKQAYSYDMLGRKLTEKDGNQNQSSYEYDDNGRVTTYSVPYKKEGDKTYKSYTYYSYDDNGNVKQEKVRNSLLTEATPRNKITDFEYDARNRLVSETKYQEKNPSDKTYISYSYDDAGHITSLTTGNGTKTTAYSYYKNGLLKTQTDPMGMSETFTYDNLGNVKTKTDRNGNVTEYYYDGLNRNTRESVIKDGKEYFKELSYGSTGGVVKSKNNNIEINYKYNSIGKAKEESYTLDGYIYKTSYCYNMAGNVELLQFYKNNIEQNYAGYYYNYMGLIDRVVNKNNSDKIVSYEYYPNGTLKKAAYKNGMTTYYSYNMANCVTNVTNKMNGNVISAFDYEYYYDGNVFQKSDNNGNTVFYIYNYSGMLTNETEILNGVKTVRDYGYDKAGNRNTLKSVGGDNYTTTYNYDDNNRLTSDETVRGNETEVINYRYDNNGNQILKFNGISKTSTADGLKLGITTVTGNKNDDKVYQKSSYDGFNQLIGTQMNGSKYNSAEYTYRPDGLRLYRGAKNTVGGTEKSYFIWSGNNLQAEVSLNGTITSYNVYGNGLVKSDTYNNSGNAVTVYYGKNGHGDVVNLTDSSGNTIKNYQ